MPWRQSEVSCTQKLRAPQCDQEGGRHIYKCRSEKAVYNIICIHTYMPVHSYMYVCAYTHTHIYIYIYIWSRKLARSRGDVYELLQQLSDADSGSAFVTVAGLGKGISRMCS